MKRKGQKKEAGELKNEKMKKKKKKSVTELKKKLSFLQEVQSKMDSQSDTIRVMEEKVRRIEKAEPTTEAEEAAVVQAAPVDVTQEHDDGQEGEEKLTDDNAENHAGSSSPGIYVAIPDEELAAVAEVEVLEAEDVCKGRAKGNRPCKFWLYGSCKKGEDCTWWHEPGKEGEDSAEHYSRVPCRYYFSKRGCQRDSGLNLSRDI